MYIDIYCISAQTAKIRAYRVFNLPDSQSCPFAIQPLHQYQDILSQENVLLFIIQMYFSGEIVNVDDKKMGKLKKSSGFHNASLLKTWLLFLVQ